MLLTLWLNALLVLTCVPGSLVPLLSRGRQDRRTRAFLLSLGAVVLLVCLTRMLIHDDGAAGVVARSAVQGTVAGMALILGIDRFMSECRALTNLVGNACATVVVARWENALDAEKLREAWDSKPKGP